MAFRPISGATFDLYREQLFNNPSTYVAGNTDDYHENIEPQCPARPNATTHAPYASAQPIQDDWHSQSHGDVNKAAWTSTFPVFPGT